jgi:ADP-dependent NAD(P)H-hydrate dehydratase / NAD(P)H-hydrate epimerase
VATPDPVRSEVAGHDPALMVRGLPADEQGALHAEAAAGLGDLGGFGAIVAGPGLGHGRGAAEVVAHLRRAGPRLVLDADGLNVHRDAPEALGDHTGALVLTPHERELARIGGGEDGPAAWADRAARVPELARRYDATIVAKGPGTLVAAPDGRVWVTPLGGPALGAGGTGDVLAGMIAAAVAAADDVPLAVARAVWWHAAAGEAAGRTAADRSGTAALLAAVAPTLAALDEVPAARGAGSGQPPWDAWWGRHGGGSR